MMLRMGNYNTPKIFKGEPANAFQPVMQQQTCIYNYIHNSRTLAGKWLLFAGVKDY